MYKLLFSLLLFTITTSVQAAPPTQISHLQDAIGAIPGVNEVSITKTYLPNIKVDELMLLPYGDLPLASIRRTNGALSEELLISFNFEIQRNELGLKGLEFLSWWVRDQSRGGENLQIRSIGLPPLAGNKKQLGSTLRFTIDYFHHDKEMNMEKLLNKIDSFAKSITSNYNDYKTAF